MAKKRKAKPKKPKLTPEQIREICEKAGFKLVDNAKISKGNKDMYGGDLRMVDEKGRVIKI